MEQTDLHALATRARLRRRYLEIIVAVLLTAAAVATLVWSMQPVRITGMLDLPVRKLAGNER
jgi:hypothetical protein